MPAKYFANVHRDQQKRTFMGRGNRQKQVYRMHTMLSDVSRCRYQYYRGTSKNQKNTQKAACPDNRFFESIISRMGETLTKKPNKVLLKGNEVMAEAAIQAGCRFFAGYPITPQNEVPEEFDQRVQQKLTIQDCLTGSGPARSSFGRACAGVPPN